MQQLKRYEVVPVSSLAPSSSSSRLVDLDTGASTAGLAHSASTSALSNSVSTPRLSSMSEPNLTQLVKLDSDIRMTLKELPNIWNTAWKRLECLDVEHKSSFESKFNLFEWLFTTTNPAVRGHRCFPKLCKGYRQFAANDRRVHR